MRTALERWLPAVWSAALALLMLGPALGPGYLLSYDMVWVPDLALRADSAGLGSALPRAVPSDAVVAVLDEVVPGSLLQKLLLVAALVAAGAGAAALLRERGLLVRCATASVAVWNPFVVERLWIGHWPVLVGYGVVAWLVVGVRARDRAGRWPAWMFLAVPLGCLSPSAGLVTAVVLLLFGLRRADGRGNLGLLALVVAGNAPWVVAGLIHASTATSDPAGAAVFAARGTATLPAPLEVLALGGIWNTDVVPASRTGPLAVVGLLGALALVAVGWRRWRATHPTRERAAMLACAGLGVALALVGWATPEAWAWLAEHVPGGGLLRDGSRTLTLLLPAYVTWWGAGVATVAGWLAVAWQRAVIVGALGLCPVMVLPDAAWGIAGELRPATYPASWAPVRAALADVDSPTLVLPFSSYRAPEWNHGRPVLNPLPRYLPGTIVADDTLLIDDVRVAGEDPLVPEVADALAQPGPDQRAEALTALGIGHVVVENPASEPDIDGRVLVSTDTLTLIALPEAPERAVAAPTSWIVAMGAAWLAYLALLAAPLLRLLLRLVRRRTAR